MQIQDEYPTIARLTPTISNSAGFELETDAPFTFELTVRATTDNIRLGLVITHGDADTEVCFDAHFPPHRLEDCIPLRLLLGHSGGIGNLETMQERIDAAVLKDILQLQSPAYSVLVESDGITCTLTMRDYVGLVTVSKSQLAEIGITVAASV